MLFGLSVQQTFQGNFKIFSDPLMVDYEEQVMCKAFAVRAGSFAVLLPSFWSAWRIKESGERGCASGALESCCSP